MYFNVHFNTERVHSASRSVHAETFDPQMVPTTGLFCKNHFSAETFDPKWCQPQIYFVKIIFLQKLYNIYFAMDEQISFNRR